MGCFGVGVMVGGCVLLRGRSGEAGGAVIVAGDGGFRVCSVA